MAYGTGNVPSMLMRRIGSGKMLVVGDTAFAMNKNLEIESGAAFEGLRENPDFWRWLITDLREQPHWTPPDPRPAASVTHAAPPAPEEPPP